MYAKPISKAKISTTDLITDSQNNAVIVPSLDGAGQPTPTKVSGQSHLDRGRAMDRNAKAARHQNHTLGKFFAALRHDNNGAILAALFLTGGKRETEHSARLHLETRRILGAD